jgi:hypothetical protein
MDFFPPHQELPLPILDEMHGVPRIAPLHAVCPDQFRFAVGSDEIDLCFSIAKDMNMRRLVIIGENHDREAKPTVDRDRR